MIRRMLLHTALAAALIGSLGFAYQALGRGHDVVGAAGGAPHVERHPTGD